MRNFVKCFLEIEKDGVCLYSITAILISAILTSIFIHRVILPVRTSIKTWLTNSIRHVTKLLMPKLNN